NTCVSEMWNAAGRAMVTIVSCSDGLFVSDEATPGIISHGARGGVHSCGILGVRPESINKGF
ncbi:MAG TPA: hypothetical protein VGC70_12830, partial [Burkholderiales bacterium]